MRSEKIKAKETAHRQSSIDLALYSRVEERRKIYERRKWLKFQKMFIWWVVCDVTNLRSNKIFETVNTAKRLIDRS
jgi:hypothetical protein